VTNLLLATAAFLGTHFVSSTPLRARLAATLGEWPYRGLYSAVAFATLLWMIWAYAAAPHEHLWQGTRTPAFLRLSPQGQVPVIELEDGRSLGQSNAIIRYLARDSALLPADAFAQAKVDELLFWEQYSHEPYVAVARFQVAFLGKAIADLEPRLVERGHAALARMELQLGKTPFLVGEDATLADIALVAYIRWADDGGFALARYPAVTAWIGRVEEVFSIKD
jgi:glutathione S-transferase